MIYRVVFDFPTKLLVFTTLFFDTMLFPFFCVFEFF